MRIHFLSARSMHGVTVAEITLALFVPKQRTPAQLTYFHPRIRMKPREMRVDAIVPQ
jgi:hypothetical protein